MKICYGITIILLFLGAGTFAQQNPVKDSLPAASDSLKLDMELLRDFKDLLDSLSRKTSFFSVSLGVGNKLFSAKNNNFNAQQPATKIAFTPSVFYYHKSGLGINAIAWFGQPEEKYQFYQYAVSPSYDNLHGKNLSYGLSYTYYLKDKKLNLYTTPFSHEFFGYVQTKKGWLKTGLSAGWGVGKLIEVAQFDTVIFSIPRRITDTSKIDLQDFSITASISHPFDWDNIFSSTDGISLVPQIMLVAGAQKFDIESKKTFTSRRRFLTVTRNYRRMDADATGLRIQSAAFSINASYYIGGFSISPGYFFSYYFPDSDQPVSNIFSLTAAYMF